MENVKIDGIKDLDTVKELFSSVKCLKDDNYIFKEYQKKIIHFGLES